MNIRICGTTGSAVRNRNHKPESNNALLCRSTIYLCTRAARSKWAPGNLRLLFGGRGGGNGKQYRNTDNFSFLSLQIYPTHRIGSLWTLRVPREGQSRIVVASWSSSGGILIAIEKFRKGEPTSCSARPSRDNKFSVQRTRWVNEDHHALIFPRALQLQANDERAQHTPRVVASRG
jgi:hypothetical protein